MEVKPELEWTRLALDDSYDEKVVKYVIEVKSNDKDNVSMKDIEDCVNTFAEDVGIVPYKEPAYLGQSRVLSIEKNVYYTVTIYDGEGIL